MPSKSEQKKKDANTQQKGKHVATFLLAICRRTLSHNPTAANCIEDRLTIDT